MYLVITHRFDPRAETRVFICYCSAVKVHIGTEKGTRSGHKVTISSELIGAYRAGPRRVADRGTPCRPRKRL
jgi:hypothetical protein